ncbi:MAG: TadE/TadG family type IV pilus assembly protein [Kiloniellaceae bacterium]
MIPRGFWRHFLSCRKGGPLIEFGFIAPTVLLAISGVIDLMLVMFVTSLMEGGLQDASRLGRTGFQPANMSRQDAIAQKIADATIGLVDMNNVQIATTVYPSFDSVGQPEPFQDASPFNGVYDAGEQYNDVNGNGQWDPDMGLAGLGGPGDVVLYQVTYDWSLLTPLVGELLGQGGKIPLSVSVAVRNEPWGTPPPPLGP